MVIGHCFEKYTLVKHVCFVLLTITLHQLLSQSDDQVDEVDLGDLDRKDAVIYMPFAVCVLKQTNKPT